jgi:predicted  nucleic acid-binding Zn-ribbon protein
MELQERLGREVVEGDARLRPQEAEARVQEAAAAEELRALEVDLEGARSERAGLAKDVPRDYMAQYTRILKQRGGLAVALVGSNGICSGCRVTLTPQRFNEVRQSSQIFLCESCGRFLYYQP